MTVKGKPGGFPPGGDALVGGSDGLHHSAVILFPDTEIEVHAEPEAEGVEVGFAALHGGSPLALQVADFPGVHGLGIAEQIPSRLAGSLVES